ncbi:MAG: SDR family oxidoreductase [Phycisphaerae bacterium]|nr:SDR family oxidoreductase [Phycisphaerae bacterium]
MAADRPVALVTGAGSGIGREIALVLAAMNHRLVLVGRREEPLRETSSLLSVSDAVVIPGDVGDAAFAEALVGRVLEAAGRLDVLVNNAAIAPSVPIVGTSAALLDEAFRIDAIGPGLLIARAWPVFVRQRSGCVVNISTMGTADPFPGFFAYAAAKSALESMTRSCAVEGRRLGIRAFAVAPGAVETRMLRRLFDERVIPRDRCLSPQRVAEVVAACVRGDHDDRNGQTIRVTP